MVIFKFIENAIKGSTIVVKLMISKVVLHFFGHDISALVAAQLSTVCDFIFRATL